MIGGRTLQGGDLRSGSEALLNASVFADVSHSTSLGVETNLATDFGGHTALLVIPQIHYEITNHIMIQAGAGAEVEDGRRGRPWRSASSLRAEQAPSW